MTTTDTDAAVDPAVEAWLDAHADERLESYKELLRIPSISTLPEHAADCRRAAEWIAADLRRIGIEHVEVAETEGHPIVYGDWLHAPSAPTVLVYCHYDVQPVDPLDLWDSPPFEPVVADGRILARGAEDDKGQLHLHLRAAEALLATRGSLPVNVKYVFEGEEESSSAHLDAWLEANRERVAADVAVISDTGFFEGNIPAITVALRGLMYAQIDVVGTAVDLHSGGYGGVVQNPANALATIIAALKGAGRPDRRPGLLRRRRRADERPTGSSSRRSRSTRRNIAPTSGPCAVRRTGLLGARTPGWSADARCQRHLGRLPGRGEQDDHPGPRPRQGQLPARAEPGPRRDLRSVPRRTSRRSPRRVSGPRSLSRGRPAERHAGRPSRDPGGGPGPAGDVRPRACLHPRGRLDPGLRELRGDPRPAGRPARIRPAGRATPTPRTSGWTSPTTRPESGRSVALFWDEIASLPDAAAVRVGPSGHPDRRLSGGCAAESRCYDAPALRDREDDQRDRNRRNPPPPPRAGGSTPTRAAWRHARRWTSSSISTTRSSRVGSGSTSRSRSASPRSTRRSAPGSGPASCS